VAEAAFRVGASARATDCSDIGNPPATGCAPAADHSPAAGHLPAADHSPAAGHLSGDRPLNWWEAGFALLRPPADSVDQFRQSLGEVDLRIVAQFRARFRDIGLAVLDVAGPLGAEFHGQTGV